MNIPPIIESMLAAQAAFDSDAYAQNFSELASVVDEGETYTGRDGVKRWNELTNEKYHTVYKPLAWDDATNTLTSEVSGTFPGSPVEFKHRYTFDADGLIVKWENC